LTLQQTIAPWGLVIRQTNWRIHLRNLSAPLTHFAVEQVLALVDGFDAVLDRDL
jgi:hypothetical protein